LWLAVALLLPLMLNILWLLVEAAVAMAHLESIKAAAVVRVVIAQPR
jgi:hypothetical protein